MTEIPDIRLAIDARVLTPEQDREARGMALAIGLMIAGCAARAQNPKELFEPIMLGPYALMYAMRSAIDGARKLAGQAPPELARLLEGLPQREEAPNEPG